MKVVKISIAILLVCIMNGCAATQSRTDKLPSSYALKGTNTAVVGIALDKTGFPVETVKEIVLHPGQRVVFAGPDRFEIIFKNKKSPNRQIKHDSKNGVVIVSIPKDILEKQEFAEEYRKNSFLRFDYSIIVNGKELDPPMVIKKED